MNYRDYEIRTSETRGKTGYAVFGPDPNGTGAMLLWRGGSEAAARKLIDRLVDSPNPRRII